MRTANLIVCRICFLIVCTEPHLRVRQQIPIPPKVNMDVEARNIDLCIGALNLCGLSIVLCVFCGVIQIIHTAVGSDAFDLLFMVVL
jgi:hypothetical protein